ncbi:MAG: cysteine--tRNA ligase [Candidatus Micrarchaeota archaeon]
MKLYNSLTQKLEKFTPIKDNEVILYVCGLTPYDHAHIGHVRTYIAFDILKRYLINRHKYKVYHIQNITDVDDKIIKRCKETGADPKELTERIHSEALELFDKLRIIRADVYPKVTEHIPQILNMIRKIIDNGYAYVTDTGVYFEVSKFKRYGKLSGQDIKKIKDGSRFTPDETKKNPEDFALWKRTNSEIVDFDSPWDRGRPGWHIECSAMSLYYAKRTIDIHGGARDLIFPHHENEMAQAEAATKEKFCKYWLHTGFLTVNKEKMSKSLGNFVTLKAALDKFTPNEIRLFFAQSHYRSPVDYDEEKIKGVGEAVERIFNTIDLLHERIAKLNSTLTDFVTAKGEWEKFRKETDALIDEFYDAMDEDFNTPLALSALFKLLHAVNKYEGIDSEQLQKIDKEIGQILDVLGIHRKQGDLENKHDKLKAIATEVVGMLIDENMIKKVSSEQILIGIIQARDDARKAKDFKKSDIIRDKLKAIGIILEDKDGRTTWKSD